MMNRMSKKLISEKWFTVILIIVICTVPLFCYEVHSPRRFVAMEFLLIVMWMGAGLYLARKKSESVYLLGVIGIAFLLRVGYVMYTPTWIRQHDVIGFGNDFGQAAFIEYFYRNFKLIDFDPRNYWGFFQPPLHHMLAALFLRVQVILGFAYGRACENTQVLTLLYSCLMTVVSVKIFRLFQIEGKMLAVTTGIAAIHPCYILLAGSINNDMLCILLQVCAVYFTILWYKKPEWKSILPLALCVGGSMMAKLSGVLIAPAIAVTFLYCLIRDRKDWKTYIVQYLTFGMISIPIGIWSPIRNLIKFGVPLNFTPEVGEPVASFGLIRRLFDVRTATPFTCMIVNGDSYDEFNVPLALFKTSLFGEYNYGEIAAITPFAWILLFSGILLGVFAFACMIYYLFGKKSKLSMCARLFLGIYYLTSMIFFLNLCFSIPNFSSQDFRYIAYLIIIEVIFLGLYLCEKREDRFYVWSKRILLVTSMAFMISSGTVYLLLGLVQYK